MKCFYLKQDFNQRIVGGLCKARGEVVFITRYTDEGFRGVTLLQQELGGIKPDELDVSPLPLGNVFLGKSYVYTSMCPARQYKQTLNNETFVSHRMPWECKNITLETPALLRTISNTFMSAVDAFKIVLAGGATAIPFSREFGVAKVNESFNVVYKDELVGSVTKVGVSLFPNKFYLKESLEEALNG